MSRKVASVIAAIGVLKMGSAALLNSLLRLRGGRLAHLAARILRLLCVDSFPCGLNE